MVFAHAGSQESRFLTGDIVIQRKRPGDRRIVKLQVAQRVEELVGAQTLQMLQLVLHLSHDHLLLAELAELTFDEGRRHREPGIRLFLEQQATIPIHLQEIRGGARRKPRDQIHSLRLHPRAHRRRLGKPQRGILGIGIRKLALGVQRIHEFARGAHHLARVEIEEGIRERGVGREFSIDGRFESIR